MSAWRILGLTVASSWLALGCSSSSKTAVGGACVLNSDCDKFVACTMGRCHHVCQIAADCLTGQGCVNTIYDNANYTSDHIEKIAICQLPAEAACTGTVCKGGLLCASDLRCRTGCASFTDCTYGQLCASGVCAYPLELDANGQLPQKNPSLTSDAGADVPPADAGGQDGGSDQGAASGPEGGAGDGAAGDSPNPIDAPAVETALPDAPVVVDEGMDDSAVSTDADAGGLEVD
jgi:hypothetical protein